MQFGHSCAPSFHHSPLSTRFVRHLGHVTFSIIMVMVNRTKVLCQHKQPKWVIYWFLETIFVIQGLLSVVYVVAMIILILSVIGEPISGADCTMVRTQGNGMVLRMPGMQGAECWVEESDGGENKLWGMRGSFSPKELNEHPPR